VLFYGYIDRLKWCKVHTFFAPGVVRALAVFVCFFIFLFSIVNDLKVFVEYKYNFSQFCIHTFNKTVYNGMAHCAYCLHTDCFINMTGGALRSCAAD